MYSNLNNTLYYSNLTCVICVDYRYLNVYHLLAGIRDRAFKFTFQLFFDNSLHSILTLHLNLNVGGGGANVREFYK